MKIENQNGTAIIVIHSATSKIAALIVISVGYPTCIRLSDFMMVLLLPQMCMHDWTMK